MREFALAMLLATAAQAAEPEPTGYRGEPYRGAVPATLTGAEVIGDAAAHALWLTGRVAFVDALPRAPRPDLPAGTVWRDPPHATIPGAVWLPNTGYETLAPETLAYFLAGLDHATARDREAPVVFFCKRNCWMSWNAGKRALKHGYRRVFWYREEVDGWSASGWPLEEAEAFAGL